MRLSWALLLLVGCGDNVVDKVAACRLGELRGVPVAGEAGSIASATSAATVEDRYAIGEAVPYAADLTLAARDAELEGSIAARRQAAWQVVERVLAPVTPAEAQLAQFGPQPAWRTWYARADFDRVFKTQYRGLAPEQRAVRAPIDASAGFAANAVALESDPAWTQQRFDDYLAAIDTAEKAAGIGGASRVAYSPGAMGHLVESYAKQYACRNAPEPERFATDPVREGRAVTQREAVEVADCELRQVALVQAGRGQVVVTTSGVAGDLDLYVRRGAPPTTDRFDCRSDGDTSDELCSVDGEGPIYVALFGAAAGDATVDIAYVTEDVRDPSCLDGEMPRDAVVVKADWRRQLTGETLPIFYTSAPRLLEDLAGDATWKPDGVADPSPADIFTIELPTGARFRMPALHIMSKELDHWMWITLWYSTVPDGDFGSDRPASIAALPGPWRNYSMCVTTSYLEGDPDPRANDSLADELEVAYRGVGGPTWCSNPYLEEGRGNASTNCIGCHQHGGTSLMPEQILAAEPLHGVTRTRNNFFTDYLWVVKGGNGEDLSSIVQAEVDFWDANDP